MQHSEPELLGCRLAALITQVDVVSLPVVAEDAGVLHGQMRQPLVIVLGRVAPLADQFGDEVVGGAAAV